MRLLLAAIALVAVGLAGFAVYLQRAPASALDEAQVRSIVAEMLAERDAELTAKGPISSAELDPSTLGPMIEDYLMGDPRILQRMSSKLEGEIRAAEAAAGKAAIASMQDAIFNDPDHIVVGNPDGDVTLVELFDYNCSYCRSALPDLATLIAEDPNLKVVLKEFPILSKDSVDAARIGVLVSQQPGVDYWDFHQALYSTRGLVTGEVALATAQTLGLNPITLELDMDSEQVTAIIQKSYDIAQALNVSGTPTYIIGDEIIPGAIGLEELRTRIANMRACGATSCEPPG